MRTALSSTQISFFLWLVSLKEYECGTSLPFNLFLYHSITLSLSSESINSKKGTRSKSNANSRLNCSAFGFGKVTFPSWIIKMASLAFSTSRRYFSSDSLSALSERFLSSTSCFSFLLESTNSAVLSFTSSSRWSRYSFNSSSASLRILIVYWAWEPKMMKRHKTMSRI